MKHYNEAELSALKLSEVTELYNEFAAKVDAKPVKKFRDKPKAIERTLEVQNVVAQKEWEEELEEKAEEARKEDKIREAAKRNVKATAKPVSSKPAKKGNSKTNMNAKVVIAKERNNKEGSIGDQMFTAVKDMNEPTVQQLVDYMVENYRKPRSNLPVTAGFVVSTIRYFVKEGTLKFS